MNNAFDPRCHRCKLDFRDNPSRLTLETPDHQLLNVKHNVAHHLGGLCRRPNIIQFWHKIFWRHIFASAYELRSVIHLKREKAADYDGSLQPGPL